MAPELASSHDDSKFRALLEAAPDAMIIIDARGEIALVNAQAERLFEFTREELVGRPLEVLVPPRFRDAHPGHVREYLASPRQRPMGVALHLYGFKKSGHEFPVEISLSPIDAGDGLLVCASIRDASEHQQAERALRERGALSAIDLEAANQRLRAMIDLSLHISSARDMPKLLDLVVISARRLFSAGCVTVAVFDRDDPNLAQVATTAPADARAWTSIITWPTGVLERVIADREVICALNPGGHPEPIGLPDGHPSAAAFLASPIASPHAVYGWICVTNESPVPFNADDVELLTALAGLLGRVYANNYLNALAQQRADALERSEARTRYLLQAARVGTWDHDYVKGTLVLSDVLQHMLGLSLGEFAHTLEAFLERVHPEDRQKLAEVIDRARFGSGEYTIELRTNPAFGQVRWIAGAGRVIVDTERRLLRVVGVAVDETDRKTLEAQYLQAQKMEAMGQLAGGVAHDFNNMLGAVLGYTELLLEDFAATDPHAADLREIQKAATTATALTRQLLAFSRRQIVQPTLVDLSDVTGGMRDMVQRMLGEDVLVVMKLDPQLPPIRIDRTQIEQVVMNLAVNARDAMPDGGTLTIETAASARDGRAGASLTVTDTGTGIPEDVRTHIFEPFFTTKEEGKGTGLGLATVFGIATQNGGHVDFVSEPGRGTAFTIEFPAADPADAPSTDAPLAPQQLGGTETILVVEDNPGLREITQRFLTKFGYTVLLAATAEEARQLTAANSIALVLTDVVMPGTSGPELVVELLAMRPDLKVLYMSGYTEETIVHRGVLNPGIAFIHKPFTQDRLGRKIREVLAGSR